MNDASHYYRAIFNNLDLMAWAVDMDGTIQVMEGKGLRLGGTAPGALVGKNAFELYASNADVCDNLRKAMRGEEFSARVTVDSRVFENRYIPLRDASGDVTAVIGVTIDITEQARLAEEREGETTRLREQAELLDLARDAIIVRRFDGRVVSWNKGAERLYGYMSGDAVGRTTHALLQTRFPEEIAQIERELLANGCWEGELVHTRRDGMAAVVSSRWVLKRDPNGGEASVLELNTDITARRAAEEAHALKQEELIRAQALSIAELSTPLIPISNEILVMPLVGVMDSVRAQQVMENLLNGLASSRGQYAILDITGVSIVDTQVANALIGSAHAARLLGAEVILTGIRPEVAQTLVSIGTGFGEIVTCGTLQAGIAYALRRQRKAALDSPT